MSGTKNGPLTPLDPTQTMLLRCLPSAKLCRKDLMTNSLEFPLHLPRLTTLWTRLVSSTNNGNYGAEPARDLRYKTIQPKTKEPPMQTSKPSKPRNSLRKNAINEVKTMSVFTVESLATLLANVAATLVANEDDNASILYAQESLKPERTPSSN